MQEAGALECHGVGPDRVAVEGVDPERPVGQDAVEMVAGERLADQLIGRLHTVDDRVVGVPGGPVPHRAGEAVHAAHRIELQAGEAGAAREDVHVRLDEAGQDAGTRGVNDPRAGAAQGQGLGGGAHQEDAVAAHRHGGRAWLVRVHGQDAGVGDDEIGAHFNSSVQILVIISLTSGGQAKLNTPLLPSGSVSSGASRISAGMNFSLPKIPLP